MAIWAELGDVRRFASSDNAVRHAGLDITVYSSDTNARRVTCPARETELLGWALYESAKCAARPAALDYHYYTAA